MNCLFKLRKVHPTSFNCHIVAKSSSSWASWDGKDGGRNLIKTRDPFVKDKDHFKLVFKKNERKVVHNLTKSAIKPYDDSFTVPRIDVSEVTVENQFDKLSEEITPLYKLPYGKQLNRKRSEMKEVLIRMREGLKKRGTTVARTNFEGIICDLDNVRPSPVTEGYRNKDEFNIWMSVDGIPRTVGGLIGSVGTKAVCIPPTQLVNTSLAAKLIAARMQEYVRESKYDLSADFQTQYFDIYKRLVIRTTADDQRMAILKINPRGRMTKREINEEIERLKEFFSEGPGKDCNIGSLHLQECKRDLSKYEKNHVVSGEPFLCTEVLGFKFLITPKVFFQVNTPAAEVLYKTVLELAQPTPDTTMLDVCCGTGCLSMVFSPYSLRTIGIDVVPQSIESAKFNAELNGLQNCTFLCGKAEELMQEVTKELGSLKAVAVLNPDRGGVKPDLLNAIKRCAGIKKVVYISCLPQGPSLLNFMQLCKDDRKAEDFVLTRAIPVDMFPHTNHCELVLLFERD